MDFGDILDKWEKQSANREEFFNKDAETPREKDAAGERRYRLLRMKPEAVIDLHGYTRDDASAALKNFFEDNRRQGFEKVLIIHGKGNHGAEGILKDLVRHFIEKCSFAGESGYGSAREGGTGATWVILKKGK